MTIVDHPAIGRWGVSLGARLFRVEQVTEIRGALDGPTYMFTGRGLNGNRVSTRVPAMLLDVDTCKLDELLAVTAPDPMDEYGAETIDDILEVEVQSTTDPEELYY